MTTFSLAAIAAPPARVLLIDDHPIILFGLRQLIGHDPGLKVIAEARGGAEGIAETIRQPVDLILLDVKMPGISGLETLEKLRAAKTRARIVMFSVSLDENDVVNALKSGADGYLLKDTDPKQLLDKLHRAITGELVLSDALPPLLVTRLRQSRARLSLDKPALTTRERDILRLIARGLGNKLIARQLGITENTVKVHMKHLLRKLQCKTRVEAAVWALNNHEV